MRNSLRIALRSSPRTKRKKRRGGSWRANSTGRTNRSPRSRSPPRRRQDDDVDDAFDGLEALGEAAVISQLTDSLSSEQFVLDPPDASSVEPEPVLAVTPPTLEPAPIKVAYSPDGYGEPGATTIIQRSYDDVVHTPRRLSIDGDDPLEGDDGVTSRAANQNFTAPLAQSDTHRSGASTSNWTRRSLPNGCRR